MAEVNVDLIQVEDFPADVSSGTGTPRRLANLHINYRSAGSSDTITLANHIPGMADVVGVVYDGIDNAVAATNVTWSTTTVTTAGHTGSGVGELGLIIRFT